MTGPSQLLIVIIIDNLVLIRDTFCTISLLFNTLKKGGVLINEEKQLLNKNIGLNKS